MGNHDVGRGMSGGAKAFWVAMAGRMPTKDEALAAVDAMAEAYIGADAEFDDDLQPDAPLGKLVGIAFDATPEEIAGAGGEEVDAWYDGPETRFRKRYKFC